MVEKFPVGLIFSPWWFPAFCLLGLLDPEFSCHNFLRKLDPEFSWCSCWWPLSNHPLIFALWIDAMNSNLIRVTERIWWQIVVVYNNYHLSTKMKSPSLVLNVIIFIFPMTDNCIRHPFYEKNVLPAKEWLDQFHPLISSPETTMGWLIWSIYRFIRSENKLA